MADQTAVTKLVYDATGARQGATEFHDASERILADNRRVEAALSASRAKIAAAAKSNVGLGGSRAGNIPVASGREVGGFEQRMAALERGMSTGGSFSGFERRLSTVERAASTAASVAPTMAIGPLVSNAFGTIKAGDPQISRGLRNIALTEAADPTTKRSLAEIHNTAASAAAQGIGLGGAPTRSVLGAAIPTAGGDTAIVQLTLAIDKLRLQLMAEPAQRQAEAAAQLAPAAAVASAPARAIEQTAAAGGAGVAPGAAAGVLGKSGVAPTATAEVAGAAAHGAAAAATGEKDLAAATKAAAAAAGQSVSSQSNLAGAFGSVWTAVKNASAGLLGAVAPAQAAGHAHEELTHKTKETGEAMEGMRGQARRVHENFGLLSAGADGALGPMEALKFGIFGIGRELGLFKILLSPIGLTLTGIAAAIGFVAARAIETEGHLKQFDVTLKAVGGGGTAEGLQETEEALRKLGVSGDKAHETLLNLAHTPEIAPELRESIARLAHDISAVQGGDIESWGNKLSEAFKNGYEATAKLGFELHALTADEAAQMRVMAQHGDIAGIQRLAIEALARSYGGAYKNSLTDAGTAVQQLGAAWDGLIETLSKSDSIKGIITSLAGFVKEIADLIHGLDEVADFFRHPPEFVDPNKLLRSRQPGQAALPPPEHAPPGPSFWVRSGWARPFSPPPEVAPTAPGPSPAAQAAMAAPVPPMASAAAAAWGAAQAQTTAAVTKDSDETNKNTTATQHLSDVMGTLPDEIAKAIGAAVGTGALGTGVAGLGLGVPGAMAEPYRPQELGGAAPTQISGALGGLGLKPQQIAGFLANFQAESGFDPNRVNKDSGATGIAQWLGSRLTELKATEGVAWNTVQGQVDFLVKELKGQYSGVLAAAKAAPDAGAVARIVGERYEGYGKPGEPAFEAEQSRRAQLATQIAPKVAGGAAEIAPSAQQTSIDIVKQQTEEYNRQNEALRQLGVAAAVTEAHNRALIEVQQRGIVGDQAQIYITKAETQARTRFLIEFDKEHALQQRGISDSAEVAAAYKQSTVAGLEAAALAQARETQLNKGGDLLTRQRDILEGWAAEAVKAGSEQLAAAKPVIDAQEKLAAAALQGADAERMQRIENEAALATFNALSKAQAAYAISQTPVNKALLEYAQAQDEAARSDAARKESAEAVVAVGHEIQGKQLESQTVGLQIGLQGAGTDAIQQQIALLHVRQDLETKFLAASPEAKQAYQDEADALIQQNTALQEAERQTERINSLFETIADTINGELAGAIRNALIRTPIEASEHIRHYWQDFRAGLKATIGDALSAVANFAFIKPLTGTIAGALGLGQQAQQIGTFATGGASMVSGGGGTDSQLVQFMATPGERVMVMTPKQAAHADHTGMLPHFADGGSMDVSPFGASVDPFGWDFPSTSQQFPSVPAGLGVPDAISAPKFPVPEFLNNDNPGVSGVSQVETGASHQIPVQTGNSPNQITGSTVNSDVSPFYGDPEAAGMVRASQAMQPAMASIGGAIMGQVREFGQAGVGVSQAGLKSESAFLSTAAADQPLIGLNRDTGELTGRIPALAEFAQQGLAGAAPGGALSSGIRIGEAIPWGERKIGSGAISKFADFTVDTAHPPENQEDFRGALRSAAWYEGGQITGTHVTDDPSIVREMLLKDEPLAGGRGDKYGDLGRGFYFSDAPQIWMSRSTGKWDFLSRMDDQQSAALTASLRDKLGALPESYLSKGERKSALDILDRVGAGQYHPDVLTELAGQPYNLDFWKPDQLKEIGIEPPRQPSQVPVTASGRFARLTRSISQDESDQLRSAGYDGAFTLGGMGTTPQFVVWNNKAVTGFGDWKRPSEAAAAPAAPAPGIVAYHGSPHDFGRFDISKIGTGEGAQAYGHGLYFAENEGVATTYRESLAGLPTRSLIGPNGEVVASGSPTQLGLKMGERLRDVAQPEMPYLGNTIGHLWGEGKPIDVASVAKSAWGGLLDNPEMAAHFETRNPNWRAWIEEAIARTTPVLEQHRIETTRPGHMYEVGINAAPEDFLHWDKPLNEQSPQVQKFFADQPGVQRAINNQAKILGDKATNPSGQSLYAMLTGWHRGVDLSPSPEAAAAASQAMIEAGIPGIRYLDQGSRSGGEGTHNIVMFGDENIDILRKYGLAGPPSLEQPPDNSQPLPMLATGGSVLQTGAAVVHQGEVVLSSATADNALQGFASGLQGVSGALGQATPALKDLAHTSSLLSQAMSALKSAGSLFSPIGTANAAEAATGDYSQVAPQLPAGFTGNPLNAAVNQDAFHQVGPASLAGVSSGQFTFNVPSLGNNSGLFAATAPGTSVFQNSIVTVPPLTSAAAAPTGTPSSGVFATGGGGQVFAGTVPSAPTTAGTGGLSADQISSLLLQSAAGPSASQATTPIQIIQTGGAVAAPSTVSSGELGTQAADQISQAASTATTAAINAATQPTATSGLTSAATSVGTAALAGGAGSSINSFLFPQLSGTGSLFGAGGISGAVNNFGGNLGFAVPETSPAALAAGADYTSGATGGLFGSTTLGAALGGTLAGFGAGSLITSLIGRNQVGGEVGSGGGAVAGTLLGALLGPIGALAGGVIGGAVGGGLGSFVGGGPPGQSAGNVVGPSGNLLQQNDVGASAANIQTANQISGQLQSFLSALTQLTNAQGQPIGQVNTGGGIVVSSSNNSGITVGSNAFGNQSFDQNAAQAVTQTELEIVHSLANVSGSLQTILQNVTDPSQLQAAVQFADVYDKLNITSAQLTANLQGNVDAVGPFQTALTSVNQTFSQLTAQANQFGVSVAPITQALDAVTQTLNQDFSISLDAALSTAIDGGNNFIQTLLGVHQAFVQNTTDATALANNQVASGIAPAPAAAAGSASTPPGQILVGEKGPEWMLPHGASTWVQVGMQGPELIDQPGGAIIMPNPLKPQERAFADGTAGPLDQAISDYLSGAATTQESQQVLDALAAGQIPADQVAAVQTGTSAYEQSALGIASGTLSAPSQASSLLGSVSNIVTLASALSGAAGGPTLPSAADLADALGADASGTVGSVGGALGFATPIGTDFSSDVGTGITSAVDPGTLFGATTAGDALGAFGAGAAAGSLLNVAIGGNQLGSSIGSNAGSLAGTIAGSILGTPLLGGLIGGLLGSVIGGLFGPPPSNNSSGGDVNLATGAISDVQSSGVAGNDQATSDIGGAVSQFSTALQAATGGTIAGTLNVQAGSRDGIKASYSGPLGQINASFGKVSDASVNQATSAIELAIAQNLSGTSGPISAALSGLTSVSQLSTALQGAGVTFPPVGTTVPGFAGGTGGTPAGWILVGEAGPEWMFSKQGGATVLPNGVKPDQAHIPGYQSGTTDWGNYQISAPAGWSGTVTISAATAAQWQGLGATVTGIGGDSGPIPGLSDYQVSIRHPASTSLQGTSGEAAQWAQAGASVTALPSSQPATPAAAAAPAPSSTPLTADLTQAQAVQDIQGIETAQAAPTLAGLGTDQLQQVITDLATVAPEISTMAQSLVSSGNALPTLVTQQLEAVVNPLQLAIQQQGAQAYERTQVAAATGQDAATTAALNTASISQAIVQQLGNPQALMALAAVNGTPQGLTALQAGPALAGLGTDQLQALLTAIGNAAPQLTDMINALIASGTALPDALTQATESIDQAGLLAVQKAQALGYEQVQAAGAAGQNVGEAQQLATAEQAQAIAQATGTQIPINGLPDWATQLDEAIVNPLQLAVQKAQAAGIQQVQIAEQTGSGLVEAQKAASDSIQQIWYQATSSLTDLKNQLTGGSLSGLIPSQQVGASVEQFNQLLSLVQGGNTNFISQLAGAGQAAVQASQQAYGQGPETASVRSQILASIQPFLVSASGYPTSGSTALSSLASSIGGTDTGTGTATTATGTSTDLQDNTTALTDLTDALTGTAAGTLAAATTNQAGTTTAVSPPATATTSASSGLTTNPVTGASFTGSQGITAITSTLPIYPSSSTLSNALSDTIAGNATAADYISINEAVQAGIINAAETPQYAQAITAAAQYAAGQTAHPTGLLAQALSDAQTGTPTSAEWQTIIAAVNGGLINPVSDPQYATIIQRARVIANAQGTSLSAAPNSDTAFETVYNGLPAFAAGATVTPAGMIMVGEMGPEWYRPANDNWTQVGLNGPELINQAGGGTILPFPMTPPGLASMPGFADGTMLPAMSFEMPSSSVSDSSISPGSERLLRALLMQVSAGNQQATNDATTAHKIARDIRTGVGPGIAAPARRAVG